MILKGNKAVVFELKKSREGSWPLWECYRNMSATAATLAINETVSFLILL